RERILEANREDKRVAEEEVKRGTLSLALWKRLDLEGAKFDALLAGIDDVRRLDDPVGKVTLARRLDEGLDLYRVTCPLGVIGVIFEARPDAAVQISVLGLKSSNAVILKGGSEASRTNRALVECMRSALADDSVVPVDTIQLLTTRAEVADLLQQDRFVDLVIPRGSNELVRSIQASTRIPVLGHADGICSVYLDRAADPDRAVAITLDAKTQYPAVCNAAETLLIHSDLLGSVWPRVAEALSSAGVEIRADERARKAFSAAKLASSEDFDTEFLDLTIAVKTVDSLDEAIDHINEHGSHHTDAIVTEDRAAAERFLARVDSAGVYHNASTRFADGFRYGFGAEVGVSSNKTHARGPVGLDGLVIYKYRLYGSGQGVANYGPGKRPYLHAPLAPELPPRP
ncbi:MAG TPA: glutamate-5-semialdehyde dehydrogenase, partial [Planctomycetota bacterium]|nr:glutamate-5-semialdehyde dehydrogenase [Planctomycetota bacterium]